MRDRDDRLEGWVAYFDQKLRRVGEAATTVDRNLARRIDGLHQRLSRLEEAQEPSQPPGATIPPSQGVGMGEGKKVAQDGAEEAREAEEAVGRIVNEAIQRAVGRLLRGEMREQPKLFTDSDGLQLERKVEELGRRVKELERSSEEVVEQSASAYWWKKFREDLAENRKRLDQFTQEYQNRPSPARGREDQDAPAPRPPCDCPHEMRSDCATHNPHPSTTFAVCDLHHYCGPWPCPSCPPAPPPSAEPAEETSSGRESCGEGTAGGVGHTCSRKGVDIYLTPALIQYEGWSFCPRCGDPLREDGELRVGRDAARPPSPEEMEAAKEALAPDLTLDGEGCIQATDEAFHPRDSEDTLAGGEG